MLRSIGAVAAGYIIFGASAALLFQLSGQEPHADAPLAFKVASIVWGAAFALVAGWLTARVAGRRPLLHTAIVAALIAAGAGVSLMARPVDAIWSQLAALVVMAPCAFVGGVISSRVRPDDL
jgi:MFS-type transporter involved in bile tolerance (Atg22 family)